jgi:cytosine/uracil/thiamine/allantoin permease
MCDLLKLQKISTKVVDFGSQNVKWYHLVHLGIKVVVLCYLLIAAMLRTKLWRSSHWFGLVVSLLCYFRLCRNAKRSDESIKPATPV